MHPRIVLPLTLLAVAASGVAATPASAHLKPTVRNEMRVARSFLGTPYVWAGASRRGVDCSGLVYAVFRKLGITLPHNSVEQKYLHSGGLVRLRSLKRGDLVFFGSTRSPSHVGIYLGGGRFVHASSSRGRVIISNLRHYTRWAKPFAGGRRILHG